MKPVILWRTLIEYFFFFFKILKKNFKNQQILCNFPLDKNETSVPHTLILKKSSFRLKHAL